MSALGDPVIFFRDAAAHAAGEGTPARIVALHSGGTTASIVTQEDPAIPYGPQVAPYPWTADAAEVGLVVNPSGYYAILAQTTQVNVNGIATAQASADASANAAGRNLTPFQLIESIPGTWTYDGGINGWHERFGKELFQYFVSAAQDVVQYRIKVKDVNSANGNMSIQVYKSPRVGGSTPPTYSLIASTTSAANGTIQELLITLPAANGESIHRFNIDTGLDNGGIAIADQYQLLQIYPEV